jgi:hypothetical protein
MHSILAFVSCSTLLSTTLALRALDYTEAEVDDPLTEKYVSLIQVDAKTGVYKVSTGELHFYSHVNRSYPHRGPIGGAASPVSLLHVPYDHIAVNVSYSNLQEEIMTFPQRRPREFNVILATCKTWLADITVQFLSRPQHHEHSSNSWTFDIKRSAAFAIFGFLYIGLTQWFLYVTVLTWLFPDALIFANAPWAMKMADTEGQLDMLGQIIVDNLIFNTLIYFPAFYMIKSFLQGKGSIPSRIQEALHKYSKNIWQDNLRSCAVWIPADFFVFACPMYMRMPLEHGVSFGWTMFMSFSRGAGPEGKEAVINGKLAQPPMAA